MANSSVSRRNYSWTEAPGQEHQLSSNNHVSKIYNLRALFMGLHESKQLAAVEIGCCIGVDWVDFGFDLEGFMQIPVSWASAYRSRGELLLPLPSFLPLHPSPQLSQPFSSLILCIHSSLKPRSAGITQHCMNGWGKSVNHSSSLMICTLTKVSPELLPK